jgi:hypothetical protein
VALVGKASGIGRLGERHAIQDQLADTLQSAHGQEPVRARSVGGAELPRERPAVEPARRFELAIADSVRKMLKQHLTRPAQPRSLKREVAPNNVAAGGAQRLANRQHNFALPQVVERVGGVRQSGVGGRLQPCVFADRVGQERQLRTLQRLQDKLGGQVEDAVGEARLAAGAPVVQLVGVEHENPARQAVARLAAVVEGLHAR